MMRFPDRILTLPRFDGPFDARRLVAQTCDVLFASYPAGTFIEPHTHPTENVGVVTSGELIIGTDAGERRLAPGEWYHLSPEERHWARFDVETSEIEFWFDPAE
jgi:quercetin dioxygenase-like cupin family protein